MTQLLSYSPVSICPSPPLSADFVPRPGTQRDTLGFARNVQIRPAALSALFRPKGAIADEAQSTVRERHLRELLEPLMCKAIFNGTTATSRLSLLGVDYGKLSCSFDKDAALTVDVRQDFIAKDNKKFFKIIHLVGSSPEIVEVYAKICVGEDKPQIVRQTAMKLLENEADISDAVHRPQQKGQTAPEEAGTSSHLINIRKVFHRKFPTCFKGILMELCDAGDASSTTSHSNFPSELGVKGTPGAVADTVGLQQQLLIAYQAALALAHLHDHQLCHLDIKPENIFLKSEHNGTEVRLADFECSKRQGQCSVGRPGTFIFLPPEVLTSYFWNVRPSIDMWAFGLTLLELTHGKDANLFSSTLTREIFSQPHAVINEKWQQLRSKIVNSLTRSSPIDALIVDLLNLDPNLRPSAQKAAERLFQIRESL